MIELMDGFKKYLFQLDSKQKTDQQFNDLVLIRDIANHIKLVKATKKERPLLQYGTFFDGENLHYDIGQVLDAIIVNDVAEQDRFNHIVLNHIIHFINGAQFSLGSRVTESTLNWYKSITALMFAHFGISGVKPKYSQSIKSQFYEKHHIVEKGYGLIFAPHRDTGKYFYENYEMGKITLPKRFSLRKDNVFDCVEGIIYVAVTSEIHFNKSKGIQISDCIKRRRSVVLIKEEDGTLTRTNFMTNKAKELRSYKEVMDMMTGDDDIYDD